MKTKNEQRHNALKASPDIKSLVPGIKALHKINRKPLNESLKARSTEALIRSLRVEMDAKNEAYSFLIENGHFESFRTGEQLINEFQSEMDAKNEAYYFILENGHFFAFREYCYRTRAAKQQRAFYDRTHKS